MAKLTPNEAQRVERMSAPDDLPLTLKAGTWIRAGYGPMQTYSEATLCRVGTKRRRSQTLADEDIYESGWGGSDTLNFGPEHVIWEQFEPGGRERIDALARQWGNL